MSLPKKYHDILPLSIEPLSIIELAKIGCLPPALHINQIALLRYPNENNLQNIFKILLEDEIINNHITVMTVGESSDLMIEWERSRNVKRTKEQKKPGLIPYILTGGMIAHFETDILPDQDNIPSQKQKMFVVHRDEMKKWLEQENEWPLDKENLLSKWWPVESEEISQDIEAATSDRISVKELIEALDKDPIYSNNKRSFIFLREIVPEKDMPPSSPLGRSAYSLLFVLAWISYSKPSLKIYMPGKKKSTRLDWEVAKTFTDYRSAHGYQIKGSTRSTKFGDFEIDVAELRQFLLAHEFCLPAKLFPRDPANCQRRYEIEQENYQRNFREEVQFSQLLPKLQEDVIESVKNRQQQQEIEFCKRAVRALDDLNKLLIKNERTEEWQQKKCLSDECLEAIDYIELRCRPFVAPECTKTENIFRREGQMWTLRYNGVTKYFSHSKGLLYISYLLGTPYQEYHVTELVKAAENPENEVLSFSSGEVSTKETVENYRKKLSDIRRDLSEADDIGNPLLKKELLKEKEAP